MAGILSSLAVIVCFLAIFVNVPQTEGATQVIVGGVVDRRHVFGFRHGLILHNTRNNMSQFNFLGYINPALLDDTFNVTRRLCALYAGNCLLTGGHSRLLSLNTFQTYANHYLIPFVTASQSKTDMGLVPRGDKDFLVSMMPSLVQPIEDSVRYYKWNAFAYIYSTPEGLQRYQTLALRFPPNRYDIKVREIGNDEETRNLLKSFRDSGRTRIICDTTSNDTVKVLKQANALGMITSAYHYLFLDLDIGDVNMQSFVFGGMNVTGFQILNKTDPYYQLLQAKWNKVRQNRRVNTTFDDSDVNSPFSVPTVQTMTALTFDVTRVFAEAVGRLERDHRLHILRTRQARKCSELMFTMNKYDYNVLSYLKELSFKSATGNIAFDANGERANYTLNVLGLRATGLQQVGKWEQNGTPRLVMEGDERRSFSQESNKTIIITTVNEPPFMMIKHPPEEYSGNDRYEGYCVDLLERIIEHHPFKFEIRMRNDSKYGNAIDGGEEWDGMIGDVMRKDADLAIAPLTINSERERVIDFTKPYMSLGVSIMIKKPQNTRPSVFSFLHPLSYEIWLSITFAYLGVSVVLFLVSRFSPDEWYTVEQGSISCAPSTDGDLDNVGPRDKKANNFSIQNSLWFSMGALMQQGCEVSPKCLSGRIIGGVWWFFTLIIISSYTANLAAFLTVERMSSPINSAEDLVNRKDMSYGIQDSGSTKQFFSTSKIETYQRMWKAMITANPSPFTNSSSQGIERVRQSNGKYAFLLESTMNEYQSQQKPCDTTKVGSNLDSKSYGVGVARDMTLLRDELTLAILQLGEDGVLDALKKKWWYDKGECDMQPESMDKASALSLSNVAGIFYILVVGMGVAMSVAVAEFYWRSRAQSFKEKVSLSHALKAKIRMSVTGEKGMPTFPIMRPINHMACEKALLSKDRESPAAIKRGQTSV